MGRGLTEVHKRKSGCNFQERLVLQRNGPLFPSELLTRLWPSAALSAVKIQEGFAAFSKGLCFGIWLKRQCSF